MTTTPALAPYPYFTDAFGTALDGGKIYIGTAGLDPRTNPITVYQDAANTITWAQPLRTVSGYPAYQGSPSNFYPTASTYSIVVTTSTGAVVFRNLNVATGDTQLRADLAASTGASLIGFLQSGTGAVARTAQDKMRETVSVFDYMTNAQVADVQSYAYALDVTTAVQAAMNAAYANEADLFFPAGGYLVTGLQIPGTNDNAGKAARFHIYGAGFGEVGIIGLRNKGTVLYSVTDAPIFNYTATVAGQGNGEVEIDCMALWGNSTTPIIELDTLFGLSSVHHCNIKQSGTGDGIKIGWGATYDIHHNYIAGASYAVASGLGASRTGVGVNCAQDTRSGGLQKVRYNTVGGWNTCIRFGVTNAAGVYTYAPICEENECSFFYNGVEMTNRCESGSVTKCYFEGQDGGVAVIDDGNYNRVQDNFFFFNGGGCTMIKSTAASRFGGRYTGNVFYMFNGANTIGIDVASNAVNGGPGKTVSNNHFILSAGTAGVVGIKLAGVDPRVNMAGNDFQPAGAWTGTDTFKISNTSTASDESLGTAVYGLGFASSISGAIDVPTLSRGALNLAVEPTVLDNTNIAAGILTLGQFSAFTFTPTANIAITRFTGPNMPDKTFSVHVTATAFAVTFTHGTYIKLAGSANLVTGANGCWITFQIKPGGIAWETGRVVY